MQSVIWGINAFDQWGVELGKEMGDAIYAQLNNHASPADNPSTQGLIALYRQANSS